MLGIQYWASCVNYLFDPREDYQKQKITQTAPKLLDLIVVSIDANEEKIGLQQEAKGFRHRSDAKNTKEIGSSLV